MGALRHSGIMEYAASYRIAEPLPIPPEVIASLTEIGEALQDNQFLTCMDAESQIQLISPLITAHELGGATDDEILAAWASPRPVQAFRQLTKQAASRLSFAGTEKSLFLANLDLEGTITLSGEFDLQIYQLPTWVLRGHCPELLPIITCLAREIAAVIPHSDLTDGWGSHCASDILSHWADKSNEAVEQEVAAFTSDDVERLMEEGEATYLYYFPIEDIPALVKALRQERDLHHATPANELEDALACAKIPSRFAELGEWMAEASEWLATKPTCSIEDGASFDVSLASSTYLYGSDDVWPVIAVEGNQLMECGETPNLTFDTNRFRPGQLMQELRNFSTAHQLLTRLNDITDTLRTALL